MSTRTQMWLIGLLISILLAMIGVYATGNEQTHGRLYKKASTLDMRLDAVERDLAVLKGRR